MPLQLYDTLRRRVEPFQPIDPGCPTMYVCGPTVYNYVHIGNARGPVVFGVLAALLKRRYGAVRYARNITDVDDKINAAAQEQGVPISVITDKFAAAYREDMAALGVDGDFAPGIEPSAVAHIPQMIAMIQRLIDQGHAYAAEGHVLFAVESFPGYGKLSRRDPEEMIAGARIEVAPYKRSPGDFVLWKPSSDDLPGWDSPWGRGRPGWHIECSAMAAEHLGETIDIHAGGNDLMFPHHENEVAQSECAHRHADGSHAPFAHWWMHNGMLNFGGSKMAKSVGNIQRVHDLVRECPPEALRYALLSAHYRQPLEWSDGLVEQSIKTLDRLYGALRDAPIVDLDMASAQSFVPSEIESALDDDLNTPHALALINSISRKIQSLLEALRNCEKLKDDDFSNELINILDSSLELNALASMLDGHIETAEMTSFIQRSLKESGFSKCSNLLSRPVKTPIDDIASKFLVHFTRQVNEQRQKLLGGGLALGLLQQSPEAWFARGASADDDVRIQALVEERTAAKKARDFARADAIRQQLADEGILLEDTPQGVRWKRA